MYWKKAQGRGMEDASPTKGKPPPTASPEPSASGARPGRHAAKQAARFLTQPRRFLARCPAFGPSFPGRLLQPPRGRPDGLGRLTLLFLGPPLCGSTSGSMGVSGSRSSSLWDSKRGAAGISWDSWPRRRQQKRLLETEAGVKGKSSAPPALRREEGRRGRRSGSGGSARLCKEKRRAGEEADSALYKRLAGAAGAASPRGAAGSPT